MSFTYDSPIGYTSPGVSYDGTGQYNSRTSPTAEFARRIQLPNIQKVFLLTVTARIWLKGIEITAGNFFRFPIPAGARVTGVFINNGETSFTEVEEVELMSHSNFSNQVPGYVYLTSPFGRTPFHDVYTAELKFHFATHPKTFRNVFWQPRLDQTPNLSLRIEPRWSTRGGVPQIGGGKAVLLNADKYFDDKDSDSIQWDAGLAVLEMGIDIEGGEMSEADYLKIGTWRIDGSERGDTTFTLNLKELKTKLSNQIPHQLFNRTDFPNIPDDNVGKPIPLAWGKIVGARPILIDAAAKKFKVASHPIRSFEGVKVKIGDVWTTVNFASTNKTLAEFTLGAEWTDNEDVSVDFSGRIIPDGSLMTNCADVVADILDYVGETNFDNTSFTESRRLLKIGTNRGEEVNSMAPSLYVNEQIGAEDVIAEINQVAASSLFVDFAGNWRYVVFNAPQGKTLNNASGSLPRTFTERQIIGELRKTIDNRNIVSKVLVKYAQNKQEGSVQKYEHDLERNRLLHNLPPQFLAGEDETGHEVALSESKDAIYWAQRYLVTEAQPQVKYSLTVPWVGFFLLPTDKIHVTYTRSGFDAILEVLEVNYDLISGNLKLVCGNMRGFGDSFWFWESDSASNWNTAWMNSEVVTVKQNQGFWTEKYQNDETDMANSADSRSHYVGRWF